jgi:lysophospholipase L1-like esterase
MLECLILGDSIAVGTKMFKPECAVIARSGINSKDWVNTNITKSPFRAGTVIISLGSNDLVSTQTESNLRILRSQTQARRVYWILPAIKPSIQAIVNKVATDYGDTVLPIVSLQPDQVHPSRAGYQQIAKETQ